MKIEQYVPFLLFSPHSFYPPMDWKNAWQNECNGREGIYYALLSRQICADFRQQMLSLNEIVKMEIYCIVYRL